MGHAQIVSEHLFGSRGVRGPLAVFAYLGFRAGSTVSQDQEPPHVGGPAERVSCLLPRLLMENCRLALSVAISHISLS